MQSVFNNVTVYVLCALSLSQIVDYLYTGMNTRSLSTHKYMMLFPLSVVMIKLRVMHRTDARCATETSLFGK